MTYLILQLGAFSRTTTVHMAMEKLSSWGKGQAGRVFGRSFCLALGFHDDFEKCSASRKSATRVCVTERERMCGCGLYYGGLITILPSHFMLITDNFIVFVLHGCQNLYSKRGLLPDSTVERYPVFQSMLTEYGRP